MYTLTIALALDILHGIQSFIVTEHANLEEDL